MLIGTHVYLRVVEREDLDLLRRWRNSPAVYNHMPNRDLISIPQQDNWFELVLQDIHNVYLMVCLQEQHSPLGMVHLKNQDLRNQHAESGIYLADPHVRQKGYGTEAYHLLLHYGFSYLHLHKIYCHILETNEASLRFHRRFGFQQEGILRDEVFFDNAFHSLHRLSLLKNEFQHITFNP